MLEWLVTIGAAELGKAMFEQVLKLGQAAAEDYVKDFFKGCLQAGITAAKPEVTKKAVAEALKAFLQIVTDELEDQDLSQAEIRDRYDPALVQLIQSNSVKPILGQAFEKDCKAIDTPALSTLWQASTLRGKPFPTLPEEFDWQRVGREYLKKVRRIIRETPELRSLLETELWEEIARNTTQLSPGFDVANYRKSLQCSYGHLKLYAIDSTDRVDAIKLWSMFIEQTVREALPPMRYELPLDLKHRLQEQGEYLSPEALEHYQQDYFQQPSRKVLAAVADAQRAVILGDPGAGKSTLLQYLALDWVEGKTESLPLLVELREYANTQSNNFLDFLHHGRGVDWQFDQQQLHQHLLEFPTRVMFDGLDEVFDRTTQSTIIDDIIRFTHQYPLAQILITSRIIGYNPDRLQHAQFSHFTIQPLDTDEIHEFIDRWYDLSLGSDPDKTRLKQRLKDAITNSKAIQNLADNPLLLTMMAILNRRQELPRDRADLYDQASRVLLYHWDVDHKRLQIPMDAIGRREKQEMLRAIAYEMQAGEAGLQGNLISADRLTRILTDYLRDQGFSEPREKANRLIQQLRERNFILCYRGADTYGFMHRTFLEYFCAVEIVHRFEKQRTLTFEQLRDEVFGQHWQDETWHEVLRLICNQIDINSVKQLLKDLLSRCSVHHSILFFVAECLLEVNNHSAKELIQSVLDSLEGFLWYIHSLDGNVEAQGLLHYGDHFYAFDLIERLYGDDPKAIEFFKGIIDVAENIDNRLYFAAMEGLSRFCREVGVYEFITDCTNHQNDDVRSSALKVIIKSWSNEDKTILRLKKHALVDVSANVRQISVQELSENWIEKDDVFHLLKKIARDDADSRVRCFAVKGLSNKLNSDKDLLDFFVGCTLNDQSASPIFNPRRTALGSLFSHYPSHPKTIELLRDRAFNDPDEQLRKWAQEQLKKMEEQEV
jgi:predicted NACHT family NTPase